MDRIKQKAIAQIIDVSIAIELKAGGSLDNQQPRRKRRGMLFS